MPPSASRLSRTLARRMGPQAQSDVMRTAGNRVFRHHAGRPRVLVVLLVMVTLAGGGTILLLPGALAAAIDAATSGQGLSRALVWLAVVLAVVTIIEALDELIGSYYESFMTARLRHRLVDHVLALGVSGQRRFPPGDLLARLTVNADTPSSLLPRLLDVARTMLVSVGAVVALAVIDLRLALTFLLGVPVVVMLLRRLVTKASDLFVRYQERLAEIGARLLDAHQGVDTIRASGTSPQEIDRILQPLPELHQVGQQVWEVQRRASWQMALFTPMLQVLVLSVAGFALVAGDITAGQIVAAAAYVVLALRSVGLVDTVVSLLGCQVAAGRVGEVLETTPTVVPPARPVAVPPGGLGRLELRDVSVTMDEQPVLYHLDLSVSPGTSVALVGGSGTGKTVLASLIGRLHDPDEGTVLLDGVPVSTMDLHTLRRIVNYAFERPALLGETVHDMIAYSEREVSRADVQAAAEAAQADQFIRLLPEGYDTPLSRVRMSGGELQRLGLARAIATGARVVVLDDATSSLDTATEMKVADALAWILKDRTSIVVAHRAATAARADLVAWLDGGRVRALAPHRELWSDPDYRAVFVTDWEHLPAAREQPVIDAGAPK